MGELTIARLAEAGGVGVETVRYYQRRRLLETPARQPGGIRRYGEPDVRRLRFIRAAQAAGFTLDEVAELVALESVDDRARARALARERVRALDVKIAELKGARDALLRLERDCAATTNGSACPIFSAFDSAKLAR